jgi:murein DD-endopeptidase MepM/ murein hydrolase activator NlpD
VNLLARLLNWLRSLLRAVTNASPGSGGAAPPRISHALVLPDDNFLDWYRAAQDYEKAFERVAVVRSPAGNNLNRFRNVSAVQAPNVWLNDDALTHIRRIYPNVVRVDIIRASTPDDLRQALRRRIDSGDRFGENDNDDHHLHDRFVLSWPVEALPARITIPFNAQISGGGQHEGVELYAPRRAKIRAAVAGTVATVIREPTALGYGQYIQISTAFGDTSYLITYARLDEISVTMGQQVAEGDPLGVAEAENMLLVVQQPGKGLPGYRLPHVIDPTPLIYWNTLRLQPTVDNLRIRRQPGTQFEIVAVLRATDQLETLEPHGRTLAKVGQDNRWINVRAPAGQTGYSAAWFLQAIAPELLEKARISGVNLDLSHPLGKPAPSRLGNMGWVRFLYNVSYDPESKTYGNTNLAKAHARHRPAIEQYAQAGYNVIIIFTHQTYGEGAGYNWNEMNSDRWRDLTGKFAAMIGQIAQHYAGQNLIQAYQIWNEQDAYAGASASVSMPAGNYAYLLGESIRAIRAHDKSVKIITGGHTGGPVRGSDYARQTLNALPPGLAVDGIAHHPYGRGTRPGPPYAIFGHIDDEIEHYGRVIPGAPLWITEFGVLDRPDDPPADIAGYATSFIQHLRTRHPGRVAAAIWYAWAEGMHNGYGLVGRDDQPRRPLYDDFIRL